MPVGAIVDLDLREIDKGLEGIKRNGKNMRRVWNKLGPAMKDDQLDHFRKGEGPDGKWKPRADSTRARHGGGRKPFSKRFAKAFSILSSRTELAAISKLGAIASAQQFGGPVGNKATLPPRPHIYLSKKFVDMALPLIAEHLAKGWKK